MFTAYYINKKSEKVGEPIKFETFEDAFEFKQITESKNIKVNII